MSRANSINFGMERIKLEEQAPGPSPVRPDAAAEDSFLERHVSSGDESPDDDSFMSPRLVGKQLVPRRMPFIIGVAGGTASGKTTVCDYIMKRLQDQGVVMLSQDSFYRGLTKAEMANVKAYNFDHPSAFDEDEIVRCLETLAAGRPVDVPVYDFATHQRDPKEAIHVRPSDVIIIEGILVLAMERIRNMLHMKVFVDTDDDVRLARRIKRDVADRGRDVEGVIDQYTKFVKPAFDQFIAPSRKHADVIIPWVQGDNHVAVDLIVQHIRSKLGLGDLRRVYPQLEVIPSNFQIRGMHTIIRDRKTSKADFTFYADRLIRLVMEHALGFLPFENKVITTPTNHQYVGVEFSKKFCGVSIIRSGEAMENALRDCCKGIKLGKILIDRSSTDQDQSPEIVYVRLPKDVHERHVLLMDPVLGTGYSVKRAVDILIERGVRQDKLILVTLIVAPEGVRNLCDTYPGIKIVTTEIEEGTVKGLVVPGVGEFGDRYFTD